MIDQFLQYDKELFLFLNNLGSPIWDNLWLVITNKWTFIPLYVILSFVIANPILTQQPVHLLTY